MSKVHTQKINYSNFNSEDFLLPSSTQRKTTVLLPLTACSAISPHIV